MSTPDGQLQRGALLPGRGALMASLADDEDEHENWLLSYIDVFMLITTFFVVLLLAARLQVQSGTEKLQNTEAALQEQLEKIHKLQQEQSSDELAEAARQAAIQLWQAQLTRRIVDQDLSEAVQFTLRDDHVELNVQDSVLFNVGDARLQDGGRALLAQVAPLLKTTQGQIFIEGHTDNQPIETAQFHSNWELGAARATAVLRQLTEMGIAPSRLRAVSAADTQPVASNASEDGRRQNRRVTFILRPPAGALPAKPVANP